MALEPIGNNMAIQAQPVQRQVVPKTTGEKSTEKNEAASVSADQVAYVDNATPVVVKAEQKDHKNEQGSSKDVENQASPEQIKKAVEQINKNMAHSEAVFGIHEKTNRITIKIVDKETKELIKELPPEKTLDMIAKAWELAGLLVDEKR
jgi:flagellar protein FlaG